MKNRDSIPADLSDAMNLFAEKLPDPDKCYYSTIEDEVFVEDRKITFSAQKQKGERGMCWNIRYKASRNVRLPE